MAITSMRKTADLRDMTIEELQNELLILRKEQFNLRLQQSSDSLEKFHLFRLSRKTIARIKTIICERKGKTDVRK